MKSTSTSELKLITTSYVIAHEIDDDVGDLCRICRELEHAHLEHDQKGWQAGSGDVC